MLEKARPRSTISQELQRKAPDATFTKLDCGVQPLPEVEGRIVVLDFWTRWCQPCIDELPQLVAFDKWARLHDDVAFLRPAQE